MTVYEFLNMCIDDTQKFALYDFARDEVVWMGQAQDLPERFDDYEVSSFDGITNSKIMTINIDSEDY